MRYQLKKTIISVGITSGVAWAQSAGAMSTFAKGALVVAGGLMALIAAQGFNNATTSVAAGQREQMQTQVTVTSQQMQEQDLSEKQLAASKAASEYRQETGPNASLPGLTVGRSCAGTMVAVGFGTAASVTDQARSAIATGATNTLSIPAGDAAGSLGLAASSQAKLMGVAAMSPSDLSATNLYSSAAGGKAAYAQTILNPIPLQPLLDHQAATPAGLRFLAEGNRHNAALSMAGETMGFVASQNVAAATPDAVNAAAAMVATGTPNGSGVPTSRAPATPANAQTSSVAKAAIPNYTVSNAPAASEAWVGPAGVYADAIRQASVSTGIPAALILALQQGEGGTTLSNMPCGVGSRVTYSYQGTQSLRCPSNNPRIWFSAKSLFQITDPTASETNALSGRMTLSMSSAPAEFSALAQLLKKGYSLCGGNPACTASWWNLNAGSGLSPAAQGFVNQCRSGTCPDPMSYPWADASYVQHFLTRYSQDGGSSFSGFTPGMYAGASPVAGQQASSAGTTASSNDLMRLISYGVYANPDWITFLATTNETGAWRAISFLLTMKMATQDKEREVMEHIVAVQAAELAGRAVAKRDAIQDKLRGAALSESIF